MVLEAVAVGEPQLTGCKTPVVNFALDTGVIVTSAHSILVSQPIESPGGIIDTSVLQFENTG